jgi:hypothetical protein
MLDEKNEENVYVPNRLKSSNLTKYERDFAPYLKSNFCGI